MLIPALTAIGLVLSSFVPSASEAPFRYRKALSWTDGWLATELLSSSSLSTALSALDLPHCPQWKAALEAGTKKFVLVTQEGGPAELAVLTIFDRIGSAWELSQCYGYGMNRTIRPEQTQHVRELAEHLQIDLGQRVAEQARQIPDLQDRYLFLKAVVRKPTLSAMVLPEQEFADVVVETVSQLYPERLLQIEKSRPLFDPVSSDLFVHRVPIGASHQLPVPG